MFFGGINTVCSLGAYLSGVYLGSPVWLAALGSMVFGIIFSFFLQSKYVFKASGSGRFGQFFLLWVLLYFGNLATINFFSIYFDYYVSGILASIPTVFLSFFLNRMIFIKSNKG